MCCVPASGLLVAWCLTCVQGDHTGCWGWMWMWRWRWGRGRGACVRACSAGAGVCVLGLVEVLHTANTKALCISSWFSWMTDANISVRVYRKVVHKTRGGGYGVGGGERLPTVAVCRLLSPFVVPYFFSLSFFLPLFLSLYLLASVCLCRVIARWCPTEQLSATYICVCVCVCVPACLFQCLTVCVFAYLQLSVYVCVYL